MESLGGLLFPLLILLLFIPIFLSGRKQRRQMQEMQQLQSALEPGDVVTTTSGLRGTVVDASYQDTIDLEIAEGVITTWMRAAVRDKVAVTDEVADDRGADDREPDDRVADDAADRADDPADDVVPDRAAPRTPAGLDGTPTAAEPPPPAPSDANGSHRP